jgi:hypothetical protein
MISEEMNAGSVVKSSLGRVSRPELNVHRATVNGLVDAILANRAILKVDDIVDKHGTGKRNLLHDRLSQMLGQDRLKSQAR